VEICLLDQKTMLQVRIRGNMEILKDKNLKKEIIARYPFLSYMGKSEITDNISVKKGQGNDLDNGHYHSNKFLSGLIAA
jgi:hypothetical protein